MKRDDGIFYVLVVVAVISAMALGYYVGSSGPWRSYAMTLEKLMAVRDAQVTLLQQQLSTPQETPEVQPEQ